MRNLKSSLRKVEAAKELLIRRRARKNILDYANAIDIPGAPVSEDPEEEFFRPIESRMALHHRLILEALDEISKKPHGRLMIFAPPGSAKSSYASVVFPSAFLGREKEQKLILASYGDDLARKMGRRIRSITKQNRYDAIFSTHLTAESSAAQEFSLTNGSEFMASGILSGITGNRCNGLIIDDPIKGREQADSKTIRQKTWDAYRDDLLTRLVPGGWICLIQTRWHEDDLAGRILPDGWNCESGDIECKDGNIWKVLCLQAKCESKNDLLGRKVGEYIWPEWFDKKHWIQFESSPRTWAALYQQRPAPREGDLFKPGVIQTIDTLPAERIEWVRGWDFGSVVGGDPTAGGKLGRLPDGRFIIGDMEHGEWGPDARDLVIKNTASRDGKSVKISIPQDPGQAGKTQVIYMTRNLAGYNVVSSPESGDKITRAEPFAAQVNVGNVLMLRGSWNADLIEEMRSFPNSKHDDRIDSLSRAFGELVESKPRMKITAAAIQAMRRRR